MESDRLAQLAAVVEELENLRATFASRKPTWDAAIASGVMSEMQAALAEAESLERRLTFYDRSVQMIASAANADYAEQAQRALLDAAVACGGIVLMADEAEARNKTVLADGLRSLAASMSRLPAYIETELGTPQRDEP